MLSTFLAWFQNLLALPRAILSCRPTSSVFSVRRAARFCLTLWLTAWLTAGFTLLPIQPAAAASLRISTLNVQDGTPSFDNSSGPGLDTGDRNGIIRTQDQIQYSWNYSINGPFPANNVTITLDSLPPGVSWESLPLECTGPGSAITNNGRELTCNIGNFVNNISQNFIATAQVGGTPANNSQIQTRATISGDLSTSFSSSISTTTVSALPQYDLRKNYTPRTFPLRFTNANTGNEEDGILIYYGVGIVTDRSNSAKGVEMLQTPLNLTDQVFNISSNATLIGCGGNGSNGEPPVYELPQGEGGDFRSVSDSGSLICSQPAGPGGDINYNFSGADLSMAHFPTANSGGSPLPANDGYVVAGYLSVWVPASDIGGSGLNTLNSLDNFEANSISGQRNYGTGNETDLNNNRYVFFIPPAGATFDKAYLNANEGLLPTQTGYRSGDGIVTPTQRFSSRLNTGNAGALPLNNIIACDKFDVPNTAQTTAGLLYARSETDNFVSILPRLGQDFFVEYAASPTLPSRRLASCGNFNDMDTDGPWFTDLNAVPGGPTAITKARVRIPSLPAFTRWYFGFENQVAADTSSNSLLTNYASFRADEFLDGNWQHGNADITDFFAPLPDWTDRLRVTGAIVRITKGVSQPSVLAGNSVGFSILPTLTAQDDDFSTRVVVTDTLPPELLYVANSASITPDNITPQSDGSTVIQWVFDPITTNTTLPLITFNAIAALDAPSGVAVTNQVLIDSPADSTPDDPNDAPRARPRYDEVSVTIQNPAAFNINKQTSTPTIAPNGSMDFELEYINRSSNETYDFIDLIDVLPYLGDSSRPGLETDRSPASQFSGNATLATAPTGIAGATYYYSNLAPDQIDSDPLASSNQPSPINGGGSSTRWCSTAELGIVGCPSNIAAATAVRAVTPPLPPNSGTQVLRLSLNSQGNVPGDRYTNKFGAQAAGLPNSVISQPATVEVINSNPNLLLVKRITAVDRNDGQGWVNLPEGGSGFVDGEATGNPTDSNYVASAQASADNAAAWPNDANRYLRGSLRGPKLKPGDGIEYSIYFLSDGGIAADNVRICDPIPFNTDFISDSYGPSSGIGLGWTSGSVADPSGPGQGLSNSNDGDRGTYYPPGSSLPVACNASGSNANPNGAIVVDLGQVPAATGPGLPPLSYGFVRLRSRIR